MQEAAVRIRRYKGLVAGERLNKPLIVVVPKSDVWGHMLDVSLDEEPYTHDDDTPISVQIDRIEDVSDHLRALCQKLCPEFVATVDSISSVVRFIPVSSLGHGPEKVELKGRKFFGIRPRDIKPQWVTVPLLYCLAKWAPGMLVSNSVKRGSQQ